ncbi:UD11 glucuronosyltransferase, partial [Machaerirhynchus nigripectus]|nr:UD11 glucuronosyltransferase [Machaerirhynchus nigripectus]
VPMDGSHWLSMREVVDVLGQKGHEVVVVAPEVSLHIKPSKNFVMKMYSVPYTQEEMEKAFQAFFHASFEEGWIFQRFFKAYRGMKNLTDCWVSSCEQMLQNKELMKYLEETDF